MNRAATIWTPYCGAAPIPGEWLGRWNFDPLLLAVLALATIWLWRSKTAHRRAGLGALAITGFLYVGPFCALGSALFLVRIIHDLILGAALAPLMMIALRLQARRLPGSLPLWTAIHAVVFLGWHAPPLYEAAMSMSAVFWIMQATIVGAAAIWWAKALCAPAIGAALSLLATMLTMGLLGALLTFAERALYAPHWLTTQAWGFSPLEDQQLAGIVMWAPASAVYLLAAMALLWRYLRGEETAREAA